MSLLVVYGTMEGQTGKIARFVETLARDSGEQTVLFDSADQTGKLSVTNFDKVVLAAPVHERRHPRSFEVFVSANREELARRRTLLLSVSLSAAFDEGLEEAQDYVDEMKLRTGLDPDAESLVAGAVRSERYAFYETQVLRHVVLRGRDFDPSVKEHEFTDWDKIQTTVSAFLDDGRI